MLHVADIREKCHLNGFNDGEFYMKYRRISFSGVIPIRKGENFVNMNKFRLQSVSLKE